MSLQLEQNEHEAMADLKWWCPPLIIPSREKGLIPFTQKHSSWWAQGSPSTLPPWKNAVSLMDCAVRDGESVAWCHWYEIQPKSLLCYSSKINIIPPLKNQANEVSKSSSTTTPATQHCSATKITLQLKEWAWSKCRNEENAAQCSSKN